ncbi:glycosyltransferase [Jannaschia aquimarina]|uniref:Capsule polysaccharide biosynthesis protein n=1 Tax=Jannaschia aquimarina TaxID=935700 RepID=A0A0D1CHU2_9RHOB|nr:glycosyltransferase [Jannaschia aquimarina]KIT14252.1 Capsule polysaccharide biosynthesis protein [Jannaschia aquimarina]SNS49271.1 Predicted glycosyltransferase involved in capsule biosynthesis [Jannaschia aquimarina]
MGSDDRTPGKLTAIVPVRLGASVFEGEARFRSIVSNVPKDTFDVLVVDFGSSAEEAGRINEICDGIEGVHVVRVEAEDRAFSIGEARDIGVQHARTDIVMFHDIDFTAPPEMYRKIHAEAYGRRMDVNAYDFFCVPVLFLSEAGTETWREEHDTLQADELIYGWHARVIEGAHGFVDSIAYGSSAIVANRHTYLAQGGHNRQFYGHGAEDYDLLHRLADTCRKGPRTARYYEDRKSNNITEYAGFRPYFALYGIDVFQRGVFFVHLNHPRRRIPDYFQSRRNFEILRNVMVQFDRSGYRPDPLEDVQSDERTLLLVEPDSRSDRAMRFAKPDMGRIHRVPEARFTDVDGVLRYVDDHAITRIGFLNPYGNRLRRHIYEGVRARGLPLWTFDRGALPDSWFFDPGGFNADSATYHVPNRPAELTPEERLKIDRYVRDLRISGATLESNGSRKGPEYWRQVLGLGNRNVIFIPLQRPNDTVIRFFAGDVGRVETFASWIDSLSERLDPSRWEIVVKKHPLEDTVPPLANAHVVPDDANIYDLIELAEKVVLINSGTGVLSMAFDTPVITCGQTFYDVEGATYAASNAKRLIELCETDLAFDRDAARRFLFHLTDRVYSFGTPSYDERRDFAGSKVRLVRDIKFREIRGLGPTRVLGTPRKGPSLNSPLFYSFGGKRGIEETAEELKGTGAEGVVDKTQIPKVHAAGGSRVRGRGHRFEYGSLLNAARTEGSPEGEAAVKAIDALVGGQRFPVQLGDRAHWSDAWNTRINVEGPSLILSLLPFALESDRAQVGLLLQTKDDRRTLGLDQDGRSVRTVRIAPHLFLAHVRLIGLGKTVLTMDHPCTAAEIVAVNELPAEGDEPRVPIGPEHRRKLRVFTLNGSVAIGTDGIAHAVVISNGTGIPIDLRRSDCTIQVRVKSEDRKTFQAFTGQLPPILYPGVNIFESGTRLDVSKAAEHEARFIYTDLRLGSGEFLSAGFDVPLAQPPAT